MTKKTNIFNGNFFRTLWVCICIAAFIFAAFEAFISNRYETKENYIIATTATKEIASLRKDINNRIDKMKDSVYQINVELKVLQERVTKLR